MGKELCSFSEQLERLKKAADVKTDTALAHLLGITQGGFSNAKARGKIPHKWFVTIATQYGINLEWLLTGEGAENVDTALPTPDGRVAELEKRVEELEGCVEELEEKLKLATFELAAEKRITAIYQQTLEALQGFGTKGGVGIIDAPASAPPAPSITPPSE